MAGFFPPTGRNTPAPEAVSQTTSVGPTPQVPPQTATVRGASNAGDINSLQAGSYSAVLAAMASHLDAITNVIMSNKQAPASQVVFSVDNSNIGTGQSYKLSNEYCISFNVENFSAAYISVFDGISRLITVVPPYSYKVGLLPNNVQVVTLKTSTPTASLLPGSYQGAVNISLTSVPLTPTIGPVLGTAIRTDVTTNAAVVLPGTDGGSANFLVGVVNNSQLAQTVTGTVYDSVSAASGPIAASVGALGIGQILTFPQPISLVYGAVVQLSGNPNATSIQFLTT